MVTLLGRVLLTLLNPLSTEVFTPGGTVPNVVEPLLSS